MRLFSVTLSVVLAMCHLALAGDTFPITTEYTHISWTERDGLSFNRIWSIAQTPDGYLWLGTEGGLVRFNGVTFLPWNAFGKSRLPELAAIDLTVTNDGSLWVGYGRNGGVARIRGDQVTSYLPGDAIASISAGADGTMWVGSHDGLSYFRNEAWHKVLPADGLPVGPVVGTFEDKQGTVWVSSSSGVYRMEKGHELFARVSADIYLLQRFAEDGRARLWITDPRYGFRLMGPHKNSAAGRLQGTGFRLMRDRRGNMWVCTLRDGLWRVRDSDDGHFVTETLSVREGLSSDAVRSVFEDRNGNIWVGTENGLDQFAPRSVMGVTDLGSVRTIETTQDGSVWVGTIGSGVLRLSGGRRTWYGRQDGLPSLVITAMDASPDGALSVATDSGIARFDGTRFSPLANASGPSLRRVASIATDSAGGLWACNAGHLFRWRQGELRSFSASPRIDRCVQVIGSRSNRDHVLIILDSGEIGDGDVTGAYRILDTPTLDPTTRFSALHESDDGSLWAGWDSGVLGALDGIAVRFDRQNGFPASAVSGLMFDANRNLWMGTNMGILRVDRGELLRLKSNPQYRPNYRLFDAGDGLAGTPLRGSPGIAQASDRALWFVTGAGLSRVLPSDLGSAHHDYSVYVEELIADGKRLSSSPAPTLPAGTRTVQFTYAAVNFSSPHKMRFRYMMEGFDTEWIDAATRRVTVYTNLPPRHYRFRVSAVDKAGTPSANEASLDFSLAAAFYQTDWFYALCLISVATLAVGFWQMRLAKVRADFALVLNERLSLSREIHDTLLQSLVGIALRLDSLTHDVLDPLLSRDAVIRTREIVEDQIRTTRQSISDLRGARVADRRLDVALREIAKRTTSGTRLHCAIDIDNVGKCSAAVEHHLSRIAEEAIKNVIRHSAATELSVSLRLANSTVSLCIADNGSGFDVTSLNDDAMPGHFGITTMRERAAEIGGTMTITTALEQGTTITVSAPTAA